MSQPVHYRPGMVFPSELMYRAFGPAWADVERARWLASKLVSVLGASYPECCERLSDTAARYGRENAIAAAWRVLQVESDKRKARYHELHTVMSSLLRNVR